MKPRFEIYLEIRPKLKYSATYLTQEGYDSPEYLELFLTKWAETHKQLLRKEIDEYFHRHKEA